MYPLLWIIILLISNGCVKKETNSSLKVSEITQETQKKPSINPIESSKVSETSKKFYNEEFFLDIMEFAASIEKETFRLATANVKSEKKQILQLETLSYALNSLFNPKHLPKNVSLDCKLYGYKEVSKKQVSLTRNCTKPYAIIADITQLDLNQYKIIFFQREWSAILGSAVSFANNNRECILKVKTEKLSSMTCEHTLYSLSAEASLEELRLNQIAFNRESKDQLVIRGARFKDMIERSKIQINVPLEGKIKIIEKELEVHDDFEKIANPDAAPAEPNPNAQQLKSKDNSVQLTAPVRNGNIDPNAAQTKEQGEPIHENDHYENQNEQSQQQENQSESYEDGRNKGR